MADPRRRPWPLRFRRACSWFSGPAIGETRMPLNPVLESMPILILSPHSRCNCRCVMCDIWKVTDSREISAEDLERHGASIERLGVEWVVLSGGEPLMHSDLFRLC